MACLRESRLLYNEMLDQTKQHYHQTGEFLFKFDLSKAFAGRSGPYVPASTVQTLADRLDKALRRYLDRKKSDPRAGFPRYKSANQWHSIQLRQYGIKGNVRLHEDGKHLRVPAKLGSLIKIKLHRPLEGTPKTAYLVLRADRHWYALIVCETAPHADHDQVHGKTPTCEHPDIGLDVGLKVFLADSEGHTIANPRHYRSQHKTLRRKQRILSRRKRSSRRRRKAAINVAKTHLKIARQRRDFLFKTAHRYAPRYRLICVEQLNVAGMMQNHRLALSIQDASWSEFLAILEDKAERAGHQVLRVPARFTTQACSRCGMLTPKSLSVRTHRCSQCGYIADRDVNAAQNILRAGAPPSGTVLDGEPDEPRSRCL